MLLIEADDGERRRLQLLLQGRGYEVLSFAAPAPALADPGSEDAGYLLVERGAGQAGGAGVLDALRRRGWGGRAVLMANAASGHRDAALLAGFAAAIERPVRATELFSALTG